MANPNQPQQPEYSIALEHIPQLLAAHKGLPRKADIVQHLQDAANAGARGYFLPDEDERLREVFARYLAVRTTLLESVFAISRGKLSPSGPENIEAFMVAYAAACQLVRSADFIINLADENAVVRKKLDEPEQRFGLEGKHYTRIYGSLTSPKRWWAFYEATRYYEANRARIVAWQGDAILGPVVDLLLAEEAFVAMRRRDYLQRRLAYRLHAFLRRNHSGYRKTMFNLMKLSGSVVAELKQPLVKPLGAGKRVTAAVREQLEGFLQPGDVMVTRHDDAMSNLFLPGFWPHAAFYLGNNQQRSALGLPVDAALAEPMRFLEAKKDGVKIRPAEDTLRIDAFTVLRPQLAPTEIAAAISRCLTHAGKLYDFSFDFSATDRLACTELVYRSFHGVGPVHFSLMPHAGRHCLSAEDLINQGVGAGWFEPVLVYGVRGDEWVEGSVARDLLRSSFTATF